MPEDPKPTCHDPDFLELAATTFAFEGAKVKGRRLVPNDGYCFERDPKNRDSIALQRRAGGGPGVSVSCSCGLEGGGCTLIIVNEGEIGEYAVCMPDGGCGTSGLFCFMGFGFSGGLRLAVRM